MNEPLPVTATVVLPARASDAPTAAPPSQVTRRHSPRSTQDAYDAGARAPGDLRDALVQHHRIIVEHVCEAGHRIGCRHAAIDWYGFGRSKRRLDRFSESGEAQHSR